MAEVSAQTLMMTNDSGFLYSIDVNVDRALSMEHTSLMRAACLSSLRAQPPLITR